MTSEPPALRQPGRTPPAPPSRPRADPTPPTVLLAEDDDELRRLVALMLRRVGYAVLEARNGEQLVRLIRTCFSADLSIRVPEVIVSDIRMPGLSGLEVLEWLRSADRLTPVILLTAFGSEATHQLALDLGATCILDKPFDLVGLRRRVMELAPLR